MPSFNINDFTQYFYNPAVSVFDRSVSKSFPAKIGGMYPANWDLLSFGNSSKGVSAHKMRLAPLVAPTFTNMSVEEFAAIVPLRTIISDYETRFNYATNREGSSLPSISVSDYHQLLQILLSNGYNPIGSLLDFLGYPVYGQIYKSIDFTQAQINGTGQRDFVSAFSSNTYSYFLNGFTIDENLQATQTVTYRGNSVEFVIVPFVWFLALQKGIPTVSKRTWVNVMKADSSFRYLRELYSAIPGAVNSDNSISLTYIPSDDELISASSFDTMKSAVEAYQLYIFSLALEDLIPTDSLEDLDPYTLLPLMAYHRFHYDWNTNGNFTNREDLLTRYVFGLEDVIHDIIYTGGPQHLADIPRVFQVQNRLWNDDYFTSLLPTSAVDNSVEIPANTTVLNLASLTAWQKFVMKLSYSSRYRDVVWNIFKIKPSDARLMQSYPISFKKFTVGIGETIQTSASSASGVLGDFAGRGYSSGKSKGYHIFCEEPCVILDLISVRPEAVYADALHPLIHVDDILDFPIPDMDVLGNQPIYSDMVSGDASDQMYVFGYGRQYQQWLKSYNTVHGDFKTTLDYWILSRRFDDIPTLNDDFLRIHPADDLDNIFSVKDSDHIYLDVYYKSSVTRHVHRNVRIKI